MRFRLFGRRRSPAPGHPLRHRGGSSTGRHDPTDTAGLILGDEAEAYLNGELAAFRVARRRTLAPWMLINRIAHRDPVELHLLAHAGACLVDDMPGGRRRSNQIWASAELWLAEQLVASAHDANEIRHVQRTILVPLESRLISQSRTDRLVLGNVLADAIDALNDYRSGR